MSQPQFDLEHLTSAPDDVVLAALEHTDTKELVDIAEHLAILGHGRLVSYSRKVFIPLTKLCRNVCHYCTFAQPPQTQDSPFLSPEQILAIAGEGAKAGCKEALFTLGDKPELRYSAARRGLAELGYATTFDYLAAMAQRVFDDTGLLPHLNPGVMNAQVLAQLRPVSASMGLMLESISERLTEAGQPHYGSPDKAPTVRLETLEAAGKLSIPFTTGLLVGIGETRRERIEALLAIRSLQVRYGHIQEVIVQNFLPKVGTLMAGSPPASLDEQLWTIAVARIILGPQMSIQAPPNLRPEALKQLVAAGINDWGGVSPVTQDYVNPEAPWPHLDRLAEATAGGGRHLVERLAIAPRYARSPERWLTPALQTAVRHHCDAAGFVREDSWYAGSGKPIPKELANVQALAKGDNSAALSLLSSTRLLHRVERTGGWSEEDIVKLFSARGAELEGVLCAADTLRGQVNGDNVTYVVNRNINYTNICTFKCGFCAFSKGQGRNDLRGPGYLLDLEEVGRRTAEAWAAGATEVCLQGGIHPTFTGETYLNIVAAVKGAVPDMHVHAFSPLEVIHGAQTLGLDLHDYLQRLKDAGLSSLPGTAAEILDDEVRTVICDGKLNTSQWLTVMRVAHQVGLRSTATIMFGHVDQPHHWARHLLKIRALQEETGGFTEFVPLPFVHMEAPMYRLGQARRGPTFRETLLMHALARLVLHPQITNIQTSWVKLGVDGAQACLSAGANDLGGTLMNESISRAAGSVHGQEMNAERMRDAICAIGRTAVRRSTLYQLVEQTSPTITVSATYNER